MNPESVAFIPDGNRRFGKQKGIDLRTAYSKGFEKVKEAIRWCINTKGIKNAYFYALSLDNLNKRRAEKLVLFPLFRHYFNKLAKDEDVHENEIRINAIGRWSLLPGFVKKSIKNMQEATKDYTGFNVNLALCYDGRAELIDAFNKIKDKEITPEDIRNCLYSTMPDPELIIRTGNVRRLSGFLLWQSSYSELFFSDKYWPEFEKEDFNRALDFYNSTQRNFGR